MSSLPINPSVRGRLTMIAEGQVNAPRISSDGSTVVWSEFRDGDLEIMRARDGKVEALTDNDLPDMLPDLSADGSTVVWTRETERDNWDIVKWQGGRETVVADGKGNELFCAVSDDGSTVVWDDDVKGKWGPARIRMQREGVTSTVAEGGGSHEFPLVSADGGRIVWRKFGTGGSDLWMRDEAGTVKPLVESEGDEVRPALTPDGRILTYGLNDDVYLWNMQGGHPQVVAGEPEVEEIWPDLSADGRTVAWSSIDRREGGAPGIQVFLRDQAGPVALTQDTGGLNSAPQLSADGRTVVWVWQDAEDTSNRRIYRFDRD